MNALRLKDNAFIKLGKTVFDENGNEYSWQELQICPSDWAEVYVGPSQKELRLLREKYAGLAMQAIISNQELLEEHTNFIETDGKRGFYDYAGMKNGNDKVAKLAVAYADAMVEALKK